MDKIMNIKSKKNKFIFSLISGIILLLGGGGVLVAGSFNVYFFSYIHYKEKWVDMQYGNLMSTIMNSSLAIFSPLAGILEKSTSPKSSILISGLLVEIGLLCFYFQRNLWIFYMITVFVGFACSLSFAVPIKNACFYYPKYKGIISSSIMSVTIFCAAGYLYLGEYIINPDKKPIIDPDKEPYYPENIAKRSKLYFALLGLIIPITSFLGAFFFIKYDKSFEYESDEVKTSDSQVLLKNELTSTEINNTNISNNSPLIHIKNDLEKNENKTKEDNTDNLKKNIKKALSSFRFWRNILIVGLMPFWAIFLNSTFRTYATLINVNSEFIPLLGSGAMISMGAFSPIWGLLVDKYGFQIVMKIMAFLYVFLCIYFMIFLQNNVFYPIGLILAFLSSSGLLAAINPHVMQVYGIKYFLTIGGLMKMFNQISNILSGVVSIIISLFCKNAKELFIPYLTVAFVSFIFSLLGLVLTYFEDDTPFDFNEKQDEAIKDK